MPMNGIVPASNASAMPSNLVGGGMAPDPFLAGHQYVIYPLSGSAIIFYDGQATTEITS